MAEQTGAPDFDELYRDNRPVSTPWDIGAPQPVIEQLVAYGALRGDVLDPGTGPGHHAIYYASKGYSVTGIDVSAAAIDRARDNAETAGVTVDFQVADATALDGFTGRFDTVVDCAFYHVFADDEQLRSGYLRALHRATRPGARLFMFEFGVHNVNGWIWNGLSADHFRQALPDAGWRIDYLGPTTYQATFTAETFARMAQAQDQADWRKRLAGVHDRFDVIEPLLDHHRVHLPFWMVHATRV
ncbi:class I SAM-dependent methyltransferase [Mycobacterium sp. M1]|uniref:Class I SAM-dependent methyltransferase n=1 Tax=Mycolicibacter acidiphilus TaxID=2835306 RepID=A0ABS5RP16_9MYCO|nr:class I SAM-dependent methyltransferase [Mycolicibacter acidiphilus]MBS9535314.1 class I SAM-dependent methyltransferase [Mycolicibacter acidiphilus]